MEFGKRQDPRRRALGIGFVVVLHLAIIWGLVMGLRPPPAATLPEPIVMTEVEEEAPPPEETPPPPKPTVDIPPPPDVFIPPPEVNIQVTPPPAAIAAKTTETPPAPSAVASPAPTPPGPPAPSKIRSAAKAGASCEPAYPDAAQRAGEKGPVEMVAQVGVDGRPTSVEVTKSSGFPRLDAAAQKAYSKCRFKAAIGEDGQPVASTVRFRFVFVFEDEQ